MQMPRAALLWLDNGNIADAAVTIPELLQEAVEVTIKALAVSHILLVCKGKEKLVGSAAEIVIDKRHRSFLKVRFRLARFWPRCSLCL